MFAKAYLLIVSIMYLILAIWCTVSPKVTSEKVGFELVGGSGKSEFMTVYGGLEFGIAIVFLASLWRSETVSWGVLACVLIHGSLVLFRSVSLISFNGFESMTYRLAIGEWVILLLGLAVLWGNLNSDIR